MIKNSPPTKFFDTIFFLNVGNSPIKPVSEWELFNIICF